eukprot:3493651-Alexandrium_andersonii.AAC.1
MVRTSQRCACLGTWRDPPEVLARLEAQGWLRPGRLATLADLEIDETMGVLYAAAEGVHLGLD